MNIFFLLLTLISKVGTFIYLNWLFIIFFINILISLILFEFKDLAKSFPVPIGYIASFTLSSILVSYKELIILLFVYFKYVLNNYY